MEIPRGLPNSPTHKLTSSSSQQTLASLHGLFLNGCTRDTHISAGISSLSLQKTRS